MAIDSINTLSSIYKGLENKSQDQVESNSTSFQDLIKDQLNQINNLQVGADESTQKLVTGEADNVHDVMIKAEEAKLALELAVQVRNKLVESYQEIMKLQV